MKIPERIVIGGYEISIERVRSNTLPQKGAWALWFHRIQINVDDTTEDAQAETLLHEIIEAINDFGQLDLRHPQIKVLSTLLFATICQNKLTFLKDEQWVKAVSVGAAAQGGGEGEC